MQATGHILIGSEQRQSDHRFHAINPSTGEKFGPAIAEASLADVDDACALAALAAPSFAALPPEQRATFIDDVANAILAIGDVLIETAMAESGLPRARIEGERMRTVNQLRLFASDVRQGMWLDVTIDPALADRAPPRPDLRRMNIAVGPVAVFGASNFPLAFSVAGGDTASAFAAGCPVVVKGHPAHPATGELVARAIQTVVAASGLPAGIFSFLPGSGLPLGQALVANRHIKAVGFTGSRSGGLALAAIAAERAEPIPVYAEMSSINPVVLLPHALAARAEALGATFISSLTLGAGQFCTNPGLIIGVDGPDLDRFIACAHDALAAVVPPTMLTPSIHASFERGVASLGQQQGVAAVATGQDSDLPNRCNGRVFATSAAAFLVTPALSDEIFGASALIVRCADIAELEQVIAALEGQLTATIHYNAADTADAQRILPLLVDKAGRLLANGWPTGVEVSHAMVHGGPFPATTDARMTSVGTLAMQRFLRPVCYQDIADPLLPLALQSNNPWHLPRRIDGTWEMDL